MTVPGRAEVREPIAVEHGESLELVVDPPPAAAVPAGYVYVAPGWFLYGSSDDDDSRRNFLSTVPLHRRHTGEFAIARAEVTFADWLVYVRRAARGRPRGAGCRRSRRRSAAA